MKEVYTQIVAGMILLGLIVSTCVVVEATNRYNRFRSGDLQYICSHIDFDSGDDRYPLEVQKGIHLIRNLDLSCGAASHLVQNYLSIAGIQSREVVLLTTDEWNDYNNGHTMLGILENSSWYIYDVSKDVYFTDTTGTRISFLELYTRLPDGNYTVKSITGKPFNETWIREELDHVKDIPYIIIDEPVFFVPSGEYGGKEVQYWQNPVIVLPKEHFVEVFYNTTTEEFL